jgi:hypothetical protein
MKRLLTAGAVMLALALPGAASAASFSGQIDYVGVHTADKANLNNATMTAIVSTLVVISNGTFAANGIAFGNTLVHTSPIVFRPVVGTPYAPLWTHVASGISFDLLTMQIVSSTSNELGLSGTGTFKGPGLSDTPGFWNMTLNKAGSNVTGSFSSSSTAVPVPEPATTALFGLGMLGAAVAARRRKRAQA